MADEQKTPSWVLDILDRIQRSEEYPKRTPERAVAIARALRAGATRGAAAANAKMVYNTLWRWMGDDPEFSAVIAESEAAAEVLHVGTVALAAQQGDWRASAFWLERRRPKDYGKRERLDVSVETRELAETLAEETGLDAGVMLARAEELVTKHQERKRRETE